MYKPYLKIHEDDNLVVALRDLNKGKYLEEYRLVLPENIPAKHKFVLENVDQGNTLTMYGVKVGQATSKIPKGSLIHRKNIKHSVGEYTLEPQQRNWSPPDITEFQDMTFSGYHRKDGKVGTMNYWLVIPLVFCENRNVRLMKEFMLDQLGYSKSHPFQIDLKKMVEIYQSGGTPRQIEELSTVSHYTTENKKRPFSNVDGIRFLEHQAGCGGTREDAQFLCRLIGGYINNPNVAGATILSLGCQMSQIKDLQAVLKGMTPAIKKPVYFIEHQNTLSDAAYMEEAIKKTFLGLMEANKTSRKPAGLDKLCIGLECGGSDGFSGISANPALGYVSDLVVALGGSTILSEFPELNGVEQELINRCISVEKAKKFANIMAAYANKAAIHGTNFSMNPSPGNIKDGLITDAIKSAGAAKKGGTSPIVDVLDYTEQVAQSGLHLLCTPGNDVESTTGLAGSGANIILFTTGLGTPTGNPVAPVVKVSTNTSLAERMPDIIDFDTGDIIDGYAGIEEKGRVLLRYLIEVASGSTSPRAVLNGQDDFIPWKRGISL